MVHFRKHLAWMCSAVLCAGTSIFADEPRPLPQAEEESSFNFDEVTARVGQLQKRLERLEAENESLKYSFYEQTRLRGVTPANSEMANANAYPESMAADALKPGAKPGSGDWKTSWNNGIEWSSPDKAFKVHIGGRTQIDTVFVGAQDHALDGAGGINGSKAQDAVDFRRARLRADGTIYETIDYVAEFDFVNSTTVEPSATLPASAPDRNTIKNTVNIPAPTDLWFKFKEVPLVGNIIVGNAKEPIGFEHLTSSRWLNFMERSYNQDLFYGPNNNGFTPGITFTNNYAEERGLWAIGAYKNNNNSNVFGFDIGDHNYAGTGRLTYLIIDDKECHQLLHVGIAGSIRDPNTVNGTNNDSIRFRARDLRNGPANLSTIYADTGFFSGDTQYLSGVELAGISGPWSFQAEWTGSWVTSARLTPTATPLGTYYSTGSYAEVHYFLTGESRDYERKAGVFTRIVPDQNFRWKNGCFEPGAWQVAFRYSTANLNDLGINGGNLNDYTFGLNWFLNPNMKIQWNYALAQRSFDKGTVHVDDGLIQQFGMRLAHDF